MTGLVPIQKALVSVSDKNGLLELAGFLHSQRVQLYATGGTADFLNQQAKTPCIKVESLTQFPEMMEGRVKTLHPRIFGGILARRENPKDIEEAKKFEVPLFDLVIGNLYPFASHLGESADTQSGFIDIGGPSLIRAAAKNSISVTVLSDPGDYSAFLAEFKTLKGSTSLPFRRNMAAKTFSRTSAYDAMIASEWTNEKEFPNQLNLSPQLPLRYGENPHQKAVWAGDQNLWKVLQGKELSYNNLLDAEAAFRLVSEYVEHAVVIVKHNNPCGVASGPQKLTEIYEKALNADPKSAFGGIVAINTTVDAAVAEKMCQIFLEVVVAPAFTEEARNLFANKKNLRLVEYSGKSHPLEIRSSLGGWLVQSADLPLKLENLKTVTKTAPTPQHLQDLQFAWKVCKHVKSNAIVIAKDGVTIGIGAGQMSRVDSVQIALSKGTPEILRGAVLASDAFFPFRDNIDLLKGTGISAVIQPGGSQRDEEVVTACNELGIAMVFTGVRHFRH